MTATDKKRNKSRRKGGSYSILLLLALCVVFAIGCNGVRRRLSIQTDPPGATVWVNDQEIGQTPISHNITYSGTYKIRLAMEGKKTKTVMYTVKTPWYLWPGVDFVSENLVPGELRDHQTCEETMEPELVAAPEELFENAAAMRAEAHGQADLLHYQGGADAQKGAYNVPNASPSSIVEKNSDSVNPAISEVGWVEGK